MIGLIGATGLAAMGVVQANALQSSPSAGADLSGPSDRLLGRPAFGGGGDAAGDGKDGIKGAVEDVVCDTDELIQAIIRANNEGGATLRLALDCTYTLTTGVSGDGLPTIVEPITIEGNGATIKRGKGADVPHFRILNVGTGGDLTLKNATITGGFAPAVPPVLGGGGLLVQEGGKATVKNSKIVDNQSERLGGGIANYGITTVIGDAHGKDAFTGDPSKDGASTSEDAYSPDAACALGDSTDGKDGHGDATTLISNNTAGGSGGGAYNEGLLKLVGVRLSRNVGGVDGGSGGGFSQFEGVIKLIKTRVDHNHSTSFGGGGLSSDGSIVKVVGSCVTDNTAGGDGGGLSSVDSAHYVKHSTVSRNLATGNGGGLHNLNSNSHPSGAQTVVDHSKVDDNTALADGGGAWNGDDPLSASGKASLTFGNSEITLNKAVGPASRGGGIRNEATDGNVSLTETDVRKNLSTNPAGGVDTDPPTDQVEVDEESAIIKNRPTNCTTGIENCLG